MLIENSKIGITMSTYYHYSMHNSIKSNNLYVILVNYSCYHYKKAGDDMDIDIAMRLKQLREEKGLSQNKLSTMAGLSQSYVRKLESGESKPTIETLNLLCEALNISIIDFLNYKDVSLRELEALHLIKNLSKDQIDGLIKLLKPMC